MDITLDYSKFSFVVSGEATKEFKEQLMALGGKYNRNLTTGPGYIFPNKKEQEVRNFINKHNESFGADILLPRDNSSDILTINKTIKSPSTNNKTIKSSLPSTSSSIEYPNRFVSSNELLYQIIIETCPLPYITQKITVKSSEFNYDCIVSTINDGSPVNDIILTYIEDDTNKEARAIILKGRWQLFNAINEIHELIFHP